MQNQEELSQITGIWKQLLLEGILFVLIGFAAISLPGLFTLSIELLIGVLFVIGGIAQGVRAINAIHQKGSWVSVVSALLSLGVGILLLAYPLSGVVTLTLLLALFFVLDGVSKISLAWSFKGNSQWGWLVFSGILSLILAFLIGSQLPGSAAWVIGLLVGINMVFFGTALIMIALQARPKSS